MKKTPMIVMLIAPYLLFALYMTESEFLLAGFIAFFIVMILGAIYSFFLSRIGYSSQQIMFWCMLLKICNVPIFLLIFIFAVTLFLFTLPIIPLLFLFDGFLLLTTSMYGVNGLRKCRNEGCLSKKDIAIHAVLQFIFCADVISAIYCFRKLKARHKQ